MNEEPLVPTPRADPKPRAEADPGQLDGKRRQQPAATTPPLHPLLCPQSPATAAEPPPRCQSQRCTPRSPRSGRGRPARRCPRRSCQSPAGTDRLLLITTRLATASPNAKITPRIARLATAQLAPQAAQTPTFPGGGGGGGERAKAEETWGA